MRPARASLRSALATALATAVATAAMVALPLLFDACGPAGGRPIDAVESAYQELRDLRDPIDLAKARGADRSTAGVPLPDLVGRYARARTALIDSLKTDALGHLEGDDRRALDIIKAALDKDLGEIKSAPAAASAPASPTPSPVIAASAAPPPTTPAKSDCAYDPAALAQGADAFEKLGARIYACFGEAAGHLPFEGQTLDRLTVFSMLPLTADPARRRRLFFALEPVWRSVDGRGGAGSPYRLLIRLSARRLAARRTSIETGVASLGIDPGAIEGWLVSILETWRTIAPEASVEPWDFAHAAGEASRRLSSRIALGDLRALNDRFYRDLGADVTTLRVHYDLDPRKGKDPVAFTTFGLRPRPGPGRRPGGGDRGGAGEGSWLPGEPWVFASYRVGGFDNLSELLHETGHAIHIAAIRTRPAFEDWPDSDTFTEAIADIAALEMYEPEWQRRYLATAAPLQESLRAKYASIVMDTAWSLFEIRLHRGPALDPNRVWTEITERYLRIKPHPEIAWWAVRGQLINLPGYMLNYAAGAILVADLRQRTKELHGPYAEGDPTWYRWVSERLYRFGLERPTRTVIEEFLGRPVSPRAILDDMARAAGPRHP